MSIFIECPFCGERPIEEFLYSEIPHVPDEIVGVNERDIDRAFMVNNVEGVQKERWFHTYGCRRYVTIQRDTRTDEIIG